MRSLVGLLFIGCVPHFDGAQGEGGFVAGHRVPDVVFVERSGTEVALHDYEGQVVLLDISTMWCAPCQALAVFTQETQDAYASDGFVYVTVLQEDVEGDPPNAADLKAWANEFNITTALVVADGGPHEERHTWSVTSDGQYPAVLVVGRDLEVVERVNPPEDATIRRAIEAAL